MKQIKSNIKLIIGIIIGIIITGTSVYGATILFQSDEVGYDNTTSGFKDSSGNNVTDVKTAMDELYTKALNAGGGIDSDSIDFSTIATNSTKTFLASSKGVCINRNGKLNCFKINNVSEEQTHIQEVFSDGSCNVDSSRVHCSASTFYCEVTSYGSVMCASGKSQCLASTDGSAICM